MRTTLTILCATLALGGCGGMFDSNRMAFDGKYYGARLSTIDGDRREIAVTVRSVGQGLEGAREAGRFEATRHCINYYGSSDVDWQVGPDTPAANLRIVDDTLTFRGTCTG